MVVAVPVAGLTKRFFNHIQKDFLINVWGYIDKLDLQLGLLVFSQDFLQNAQPHNQSSRLL